MSSYLPYFWLVVAIVVGDAGNAFGTESVLVTSSLGGGQIARPQQEVTFTCVARTQANIIHWASNEFIGPNGARLDLLSVDCVGSSATNGHDPNTYATCTSVSVENGQNVFVSTLRVLATLQYPSASVTCSINGNGASNTTSFQTIATVDSSTTVHEVTTSVAHPTFHTTTLVSVSGDISKDMRTLVAVTTVIAVSVVMIIVVAVAAVIVGFLVYAHLRRKDGVGCKPCYRPFRKVHSDEEVPDVPVKVNKVHVNEEKSEMAEKVEKA